MLCLFVRHPLLGLCVDRSVKSHSQYHMRHILRCVDAFKIVCFDQSKVRPTCANSMKRELQVAGPQKRTVRVSRGPTRVCPMRNKLLHVSTACINELSGQRTECIVLCGMDF